MNTVVELIGKSKNGDKRYWQLQICFSCNSYRQSVLALHFILHFTICGYHWQPVWL